MFASIGHLVVAFEGKVDSCTGPLALPREGASLKRETRKAASHAAEPGDDRGRP